MSLFVLQVLLFWFLLAFFSGFIVGRGLKHLIYKQETSNTTTNLLQRLKANGIFLYGEIIPNLIINEKIITYPVVNEKAIRVQAGIMAVLASISLAFAQLAQNWVLIKIISLLFFIDFFIKVIIGFRFSLFYRLSNWIVRKKEAEYVGAVQKRFAWTIGLCLATFMVYLQYIVQAKGLVPMTLCLICIVFMTLEWLAGLCVGCRLYYGLIALGIVKKPEASPICPGGICPVNIS